jgi:hypothetical protein
MPRAAKKPGDGICASPARSGCYGRRRSRDLWTVVLARLKATNFYVEDTLIETLFKRWRTR